MSKCQQTVVVVGAGAGGLCAAKNFHSFGLQVTVYESTSCVGGTWDISNPNSSMYMNLRTNLPRQVMAFPDFPFEYENCESNSFPSHEMVLEYLKQYALSFNLIPLIHFQSEVKDIRFCESTQKWFVSVLSKGVLSCQEFDAVVICNGHYTYPNIPNIEGLDSFQNHKEVMHSHSYKSSSSFQDKTVVVLGAGASGVDISLEIALSSPQSKIYLSRRGMSHLRSPEAGCWGDKGDKEGDTKELCNTSIDSGGGGTSIDGKEASIDNSGTSIDNGGTSIDGGAGFDGGASGLLREPKVPNLFQKTSIQSIDSHSLRIFFEDGSFLDDVDTILLCTGYRYSFPFFGPEMQKIIHVDDGSVHPLFLHLFHLDFPTLSFIGLPWRVAPFPLFHYQTRLVGAVLKGLVQLPNREKQQEVLTFDQKHRLELGFPLRYAHMLGDWQWEYSRTLASFAGIPHDCEVRQSVYDDCANSRRANPLTYRNKVYRVFGDGKDDWEEKK
jgi:thioredoxin reductase